MWTGLFKCKQYVSYYFNLWISIYQPVFRSSETSSVVSCAGSVVLSEDLVGNSEIKVKNLYHLFEETELGEQT